MDDARLRPVAITLILGWLAAAVYLGVTPTLPQPGGFSPELITLAGHYALHALLAGLLLLTLTLWPVHRRRRLRAALLAVSIVFLYGLAMEGIQSLLPYRTAQLADLAANGAGAVTGTVLGLLLTSLPLDRRWVWAGIGAVSVAAIALLVR